MNAKDKKKLAQALYNWRAAYKALKTDPKVLEAQEALEIAQANVVTAERDHRLKMSEAETVINSLVPAIGQSITAFGIRAKYTKEYLRVSFDSKVLDSIAEQNVRFRNLIMPHRKETQVKARVNVEIADPETLLQDVPFSPVLEGVD